MSSHLDGTRFRKGLHRVLLLFLLLDPIDHVLAQFIAKIHEFDDGEKRDSHPQVQDAAHRAKHGFEIDGSDACVQGLALILRNWGQCIFIKYYMYSILMAKLTTMSYRDPNIASKSTAGTPVYRVLPSSWENGIKCSFMKILKIH